MRAGESSEKKTGIRTLKPYIWRTLNKATRFTHPVEYSLLERTMLNSFTAQTSYERCARSFKTLRRNVRYNKTFKVENGVTDTLQNQLSRRPSFRTEGAAFLTEKAASHATQTTASKVR